LYNEGSYDPKVEEPVPAAAAHGAPYEWRSFGETARTQVELRAANFAARLKLKARPRLPGGEVSSASAEYHGAASPYQPVVKALAGQTARAIASHSRTSAIDGSSVSPG
jgi:hypothetical protein